MPRCASPSRRRCSAGVRGVQITRQVRFGSPGDPHQGVQSNLASFMLLPTIVTPPATAQVGTTLTLTINPPVGRRQRAAVLIGGQSVEIDPRPASAPATSTTLAFPHPGEGFAPVPAPGAALRVRIDGAESRVQPNPAPPPAPPYLPLIVVTHDDARRLPGRRPIRRRCWRRCSRSTRRCAAMSGNPGRRERGVLRRSIRPVRSIRPRRSTGSPRPSR